MSEDQKEKRGAAASYLVSFYQEVITLNNNYANYSNLITESKHKYNDLEKIPEGEKYTLIQYAQVVRANVHKSYIMYKTIIPALKIKENKNIDNLYTTISKEFIMPASSLFEFTLLLNKILVTDIIKELIDFSQELIESVYNGSEQ